MMSNCAIVNLIFLFVYILYLVDYESIPELYTCTYRTNVFFFSLFFQERKKKEETNVLKKTKY